MVAMLAIFGPKAGKTKTPNNGICIIIASSVFVKLLSCSQLKHLLPIWTPSAPRSVRSLGDVHGEEGGGKARSGREERAGKQAT